VPALRDYLDEFEERHGIRVTLETDDPTTPVPDLVGTQLFRIAQEALANVRKHAQAQQAWVSLRHPTANVLELDIRDNGIGFDPAHAPRSTASSFGLESMRERAEILGGSFHIVSAPGSGTRVIVSVPLEQRNGRQEKAPDAAVASAAG
jgi:signal transduction histidine kinase